MGRLVRLLIVTLIGLATSELYVALEVTLWTLRLRLIACTLLSR